jgi:hypothetical protein
MGTTVFQQQNGPLDRYAFGLADLIPPGFEFIRDLDIPRHI